MILPTPFQIKVARFLFGLHFIFLTYWVFPSQIGLQGWTLYTLLALGTLLTCGFFTSVTAGLMFLLWIWQLHVPVFEHNPGAFLILYALFFLTTQKPDKMRPFIFKMFWLLFIITIAFDLMAAINTVLDLFPFGMKYEHGHLPPKSWVRLRIGVESFFLLGLIIRPLRIYGWVFLFFFHWLWIFNLGYSEFSSTILFTLPFLYNPEWSTVPADPKLKPYIFYDGICVLCSRFTRFLFKEDFGRHFYFAPLQGKTAKEKLPRHDQSQVHSVIYFDENKCFYRLDAVIKILTEVGGIWKLAAVLWLIPAWLRDRLYMWVANNRYDWFGTLTFCPLPTPEERQYFRD